MGKKIVSCLWMVFLLVSGIGAGILVQAKVQSLAVQKVANEVPEIRELVRASKACAADLTRTTAERDRLLEHLADVETSGMTSEDCTPLMVWVCPRKGGAQ